MSAARVWPVTVMALCITEFATVGALIVPALVGLQLRVGEISSRFSPEATLSWVTTSGAIAAVLASPAFGWLSDRSAQRAGHRGGWVLGGTVAGLVCVVIAANATTLPLLVLAWIGAQMSYTATFAALLASLSDFVDPAERPRAVGLFAGSGIAAVAFGGALVAALLTGHFGAALDTPKAVFVSMALFALPAALYTGWHLRGLGRAAGPVAAPSPTSSRGALQFLAGSGRPFWWLLAQRLLVQAAYTSMTVYAVLYLIRRTGTKPHDAAQLVAVVTAVGGAVGMIVAAGGARFLARRVGYRAAMSIAIVMLLTATVLMGVTAATPAFIAAHVLAGTGLGTYLALDLVVALSLLPLGGAGRLLGLFNMARKASQTIITAIAPLLLAIGSGDITGVDRSHNYLALLAVGSGSALLALGIVKRLTVPDRTGGAQPLRRAAESL